MRWRVQRVFRTTRWLIAVYLLGGILAVAAVDFSSIFLFALFNMGIFAGYFFAGTGVAPRLRVNRLSTKVGGILFFLTCGYTHFHMAIHAALREPITVGDYTSWHMTFAHAVQVVSVWVFLGSLYKELAEGTLETVGVDGTRKPTLS